MNGSMAADWEVVWSDEFNYEGLPDPAKWGYEQGYIRNNEAQFYTQGRKENARVEKGNLVLEARKERYAIPAGAPNAQGRAFADYTSASLNTAGKQSWLYGKIEMRAKLPQGRGVWPAFWMLGINIPQVGWPACGEIDIMEFVGKEPNWIYGNAHYKKNGQKESSGSRTQTQLTRGEFHVYAIEWDAKKIDFLVDGKVYHTCPVDRAGAGEDNALRKPQYILLNFAVGGEWGGQIDDSALPQQYLVDYVRVSRKKG